MMCKLIFFPAVLALFLLAGPASAQRGDQYRNVPAPRATPEFLQAFREPAAEVSKSTVRILCDGKEAALGTIVSPDGWIVTKYSLLSGKVSCKLKDGQTLDAKAVGVHEAFDLGMLKVEAKDLPAVTFAESKTAAVGSWLISAGTGEDPVAVGVLSVATRSPPPVMNRGGMRANNPPPPSPDYLGISVATEGPAAKITRISPQSPASRAGLKVDDKILAIQGKAVTDQSSFMGLLSKMKPGDQVTIKIVREGKELELKATLEQRGGRFGRRDQNLMGSELSEKRTGFPTYFQSDTVLRPKDCGGPICDLDGHVLGVNIARAGRVESYSIPTEALTPLFDDLKSGKLSPAKLIEKKIAELKTSLKKAEEDKTAADKKLKDAQEALKKSESAKTDAEKKLKDLKEALDKAEKDLKEKQ